MSDLTVNNQYQVYAATTSASGATATANSTQNVSLDELTMNQNSTDDFVAITATEANNEAKKSQLSQQKESLQAQKSELLNEQAYLKEKMDGIQPEITELETKKSAIETEIKNLDAQKANAENQIAKLVAEKAKVEDKYSAAAKELKAKNETSERLENSIQTTKANVDAQIEAMNTSAQEIKENSEDNLKEQRDAIANASAEAIQLVKSGEIKAEDIPAYVAGKVADFVSVGNTSDISALSAQKSKIGGLCSQLGSLINQKAMADVAIGAISLKMNELNNLGNEITSGEMKQLAGTLSEVNSKINNKNSELTTISSSLATKTAEYTKATTQYSNNEAEISGLDTNISSVDTEIQELEATNTEAIKTTLATSAKNTNNTANIFGKTAANNKTTDFSFVSKNIEEADISKIETALSEIEKAYTSKLAQTSSTSISTEISERVNKTESLMVTLRSRLAENAQKLIEERLAATKRQ